MIAVGWRQGGLCSFSSCRNTQTHPCAWLQESWMLFVLLEVACNIMHASVCHQQPGMCEHVNSTILRNRAEARGHSCFYLCCSLIKLYADDTRPCVVAWLSDSKSKHLFREPSIISHEPCLMASCLYWPEQLDLCNNWPFSVIERSREANRLASEVQKDSKSREQ